MASDYRIWTLHACLLCRHLLLLFVFVVVYMFLYPYLVTPCLLWVVLRCVRETYYVCEWQIRQITDVFFLSPKRMEGESPNGAHLGAPMCVTDIFDAG